jgi:predicted Zn-dependent protease
MARGLAWLAAAAVCAGAAAWCLPQLVAYALPWSVEQQLGGVQPTEFGPVCANKPDPAVAALETLVGKLYPQSPAEVAMPVHVQVVDNPQVNAFATLGGQIVVLSGLIDAVQSPEELAGILAHELSHIARRHPIHHVADTMLMQLGIALLLGTDSQLGTAVRSANYWAGLQFDRRQETQADTDALLRLRRSLIAPDGLADFFARQQSTAEAPVWLSDHPGTQERQARVRAAAGYRCEPALSPQAWADLKQVCRAKFARPPGTARDAVPKH